MIIKNGNIHVGNGQVLNDYDILIEGKTIKQVERNIQGKGRLTIDAKGKEVFPGFIDPVTSLGSMDISFSVKDHEEKSDPITPEAEIKYSFNHREIGLEELSKVGITTVGASPGNDNIIGGQMAVYKTFGKNSHTMLVKEPIGLKASVINNVKEVYGKRNQAPMTKMGIFNKFEEFLKGNLELKEKGKDILDKVLNRQIPIFITANTEMEINSVVHIIEKFNINAVLVGVYNGDKCIDRIIDAKIPIIVGEQIYLTEKNYNNTDLIEFSKLKTNNIPMSFTITGKYGPNGKVKYLWNAIEFLRAGMDSEEIVEMMTLNPAKILGIDNILGSIEEGKNADIVIYTKNPIKYYDAQVTNTIVNGELAYTKEGLKC